MKTTLCSALYLTLIGAGTLSAQPTYFTRITNGPIATDAQPSWGCSLVDYDNDGLVDVFVATDDWNSSTNALYHNDGSFQFSKVTTEPVVTTIGDALAGVFADYDNDGYLDLFVANYYNQADFLYHNERDGTFSRFYDGDIVDHTGNGLGAAWADLDNDGWLDLFVANNSERLGTPSDLYRNDAKAYGSANRWLLVHLVGTASNRSAIGAKIRAKATLWSNEVWQMREISGGGGPSSQNDLRAHFGLGDATQVDLLRIEWPSGIVQTLTNVAPNQIPTINEHESGVTNAPSLTVANSVAGPVQLTATGQTNLRYVFQTSSDLSHWTKIAVRTNLTGSLDYTPATSSSLQRFYRVQVP